MGFMFVSVWIRTQSLLFPTLLLDVYLTVFNGYFPAEGQIVLYAVNFMAVGILLFKLLSPRYTN